MKTGLLVLIASTALMADEPPAEEVAWFEKHVRPILVKRCYECHSEQAEERSGGLWLDRRSGWQSGGDSGMAITPGKPDESLLITSIRYVEEGLQMPPESKLPDAEIRVLEEWVRRGAVDPRGGESSVTHTAIDYEAARKYWALRPLAEEEPPQVQDRTWGRSLVDAFILAKLEEEGLIPAPDAESGSLIRRLYYDLTGLPPTPDELKRFVKDPSEDAYSAIVEELLSRPGYGERWGRHWLDVARYADSNGGDRNFTYFQAWRYRNYVIDAFNSDRSFYQFVREQLAGDLLPAESDAQRAQQLTGATFLALGPKMLTERDKEKLWMDTADEQVDTLGRAFLGLTLGCARCHDHKFDPVSQHDYYALAGIFRSTEVVMGTRNGCVNVASWVEQPLPGKNQKQLASRIARLELAMRLTVEKVYNDKSGNNSKDTKLPLAGIIYDNGVAEVTGKWRTSTLNPARHGDNYLVAESRDCRAVFRASLPETGDYEVRVSYSADPSRCAAIPVVVEAGRKSFTTVLDERVKPNVAGLFQPVGRFRFEKGDRSNVIISVSDAKGFVIVDAVQFIPIADIEREQVALAKVVDSQDALELMSAGDLKKEISKLLKELETAEVVMAPRDISQPSDTHLRVRGEVRQRGPLVPRGIPKALHAGPFTVAEGSSGRRELAEWMVAPDNVLLDRVMVNRIWQHLMGRGIVETVDNFGRTGTPPTHPLLLDALARSFRRSGGSVKQLVKEIVLSRTYRMSCQSSEGDPSNRLFSRQNRRRLSAEEIRDSLLFFARRLDRKGRGEGLPGKSGVDLDKPLNFSKHRIRTVYLPVARNNAIPEMELFNQANPDLVSGQRPETTVPTQALYLLNSRVLQDRAVEIAAEMPSPSRLDWLYATILSRTPSRQELGAAAEFVNELRDELPADSEVSAEAHFAQLLMASTEFLFLD